MCLWVRSSSFRVDNLLPVVVCRRWSSSVSRDCDRFGSGSRVWKCWIGLVLCTEGPSKVETGEWPNTKIYTGITNRRGVHRHSLSQDWEPLTVQGPPWHCRTFVCLIACVGKRRSREGDGEVQKGGKRWEERRGLRQDTPGVVPRGNGGSKGDPNHQPFKSVRWSPSLLSLRTEGGTPGKSKTQGMDCKWPGEQTKVIGGWRETPVSLPLLVTTTVRTQGLSRDPEDRTYKSPQ